MSFHHHLLLPLRLKKLQASRKKQEEAKLAKKDTGSQLLKILTKLAKGQKDKKEKKDKKNKRKRRRVKREEGGDPSDSSGSSPTPSGGGDSGTSSTSSGDEDKDGNKLEAPLRRKSLKRPGSVLKLLINHARQQLDQTAKVEVGSAVAEDPTLGVRIASYFSIIVKPNLGTALGPTREMYHLSNCIDLLRKGELSRLGDVLAGRFISLHQSVLDGGWQAARHLEVMPYEEVSAAGTSVVLQARKHARVAARALGADASWGWRQPPKGKGGKGKYPAWNEGDWQGQGKGKQKGPKGRGKGKGGWPGQYADADGEALKKKEKPGEK